MASSTVESIQCLIDEVITSPDWSYFVSQTPYQSPRPRWSLLREGFVHDVSNYNKNSINVKTIRLSMILPPCLVWYREQHQILYPSSLFFIYFFAQGGCSSSLERDICFSIPIRFCSVAREAFSCPGIDAFVQRTVCFQQIEYQPWNLNNTRVSDDDRDKRKGYFYLQ